MYNLKRTFLNVFSVVILILGLSSFKVNAIDNNFVASENMIDFISDLKEENVIYKVFSAESIDSTEKFNLETKGMNNYQICEYLYNNVLMIEKYYISDINIFSVGGTDNFVRFYGGFVLDRNGRNEAEVQYQLSCSVTWDNSYGIYNGNCSIIQGSLHTLHGSRFLASNPTYSQSISSNRRTITYRVNSFVMGVSYINLNNPVYYDMPVFITDWSC